MTEDADFGLPDTGEWAKSLGVSREAIELYRQSDVIDLHVDSFIWTRIFGYDLRKRHGRGPLGARFYSQADLPRLISAGVTGAAWVITTNPLGSSRRRARAFFENLSRLRRELTAAPDRVALVRNAAEYRAARENGRHGAFIAIQGGNALDHDLDDYGRIPDGVVTRVTLVHLTSSSFGATSSPLALTDSGLTGHGRDLVRRLDAERIFVDLAHISKNGFYDAVKVHDSSIPLIVTHTGVSGVFPHWRNLDDDQLRAIADSGGTVGVMYQASFLGPSWLVGGTNTASLVADHLEHIVRVVGEDHASLGSDWDGAIVTPRDMQTCVELPKLVQLLLDRRLRPEAIQKILGQNYLRALRHLRGA